jgi:hypothetical protein|tara:strand:- start:644 stop:847 length:204 start_codon:yes stop_codon:yes gene_type:complete
MGVRVVAESILSLLKKKIRGQMDELSDHLAIGGVKNIEEYRRICGTIEGLAWTEREVIDIETKLRES